MKRITGIAVVFALTSAGCVDDSPTLAEFDKRFGVSETLREGQERLQEFDQRYGVGEEARSAAEAVQAFDEKHQVTDRVLEWAERAGDAIGNLLRRARER